MSDLKCDVLIIGGGIIGASIAYHLVRKGCRDVIVVEKHPQLGMGSTSKAAGGIRAQFSSDINIELSRLSIEHFERFSRDMNIPADFHQAGYLWIATRPQELELFRKNAALQKRHGLEVQILSPGEVHDRAPYVFMDDVIGGTFHARDGYGSPADFLQGYATRARELGVRFQLDTEVTGILVNNGAVTGVKTSTGMVSCAMAVNAAGAYSGKIGAMAGIDIPIVPVRRQCFVTHPIVSGLNHPIPMTVDFTSGVYIHSESKGLLVGMADKNETPGFKEDVDMRFLERVAELAMHRVPLLAESGMRTQWAGLYEVTPDHHPILGAIPGLRNFYCAAGFSGHGVMHAPATGVLMAELITSAKPSIDITPLRWSRFREGQLIQETHVI